MRLAQLDERLRRSSKLATDRRLDRIEVGKRLGLDLELVGEVGRLAAQVTGDELLKAIQTIPRSGVEVLLAERARGSVGAVRKRRAAGLGEALGREPHLLPRALPGAVEALVGEGVLGE